MQRFFRPGRVIAGSNGVWLLDEHWPAAALVAGDSISAVIAWSWPERCPDGDDAREVVSDGIGIVVREGGQLTWLSEDGCVTVPVDSELHLAAADEQVAWLVDRSSIDPGHPPAPPPPLPAGRIVAMARNGGRTELTTTAPVKALTIRGADVWLTLSEPPRATPHPHGGGWSFSYPTRQQHVDRAGLLTGGLDGTSGIDGDDGSAGIRPFTRRGGWTWLETDPNLILRYGVRAGGLVWWAGTPTNGDRVNRMVVLAGHDATTAQPVVRMELGVGMVGDLAAIGDEVWISIARRRFLAAPHDTGVDVLAISPSGYERTVYEHDSIDISDHAPHLLPLPDSQIRQHIAEIRAKFENLETYWRSQDGTTRPLADGLSDASTSLRGTWPAVELAITLRHDKRPGLTLRRTLDLFDEQGCPINHQYADIYLMEDLDTDYIAPAHEAVDGILDT